MTKRICALILAAVLLLTFAGCHKKGETVMTIDGYDISSGLYLAEQMDAFNQFASKVKTQISSSYKISSIKEYMKFTLDGVKASDWIYNTTLASLKEYVAVEKRFENAGLEFTSDDETYANYYADYYWKNYSLADLYEKNGISKASYSLIWQNYVKKNDLFLYNYDAPDETTGLGGVMQVPDSDLVSILADNYVLANQISVSTTTTNSEGNTAALSDDEIKAIGTKLQGYASRINKGSSDFDTIKAEYDAETGSDTSSDSTASNVVSDTSSNTASTSIYPKSATAYSSKDSDTTNYTLVKTLTTADDFEYGKAIVTDDSSSSGKYYLTIVYDISKDPYYLDYYHTQLLYLLKQDEFDNLLKSDSDSWTVDTNKSLISYYSPNKIEAASSK